MTLCIATPSDAGAIADLVRLAFGAQSRPTNPPSGALKETADTVRDHLLRGGGVVVEIDGALVGTLLWEEQDGALYLTSGRASRTSSSRHRAEAGRSGRA